MIRSVVLIIMLSASTALSQEVLVRQWLDRQEAYAGEQVVNTLEFLTNTKVQNPQLVGMSYDDFWSLPLGEEEQGNTILGGEGYKFIRFKRAIFPLRAGQLTIPSRRLMAKVLLKKKPSELNLRDVFGALLGTAEYTEQIIDSNPVDLTVRPIPPAQSDVDAFNIRHPIVGATELVLRTSSSILWEGQTMYLDFELTSLGNLSSFTEIPLNLSGRAKLYPEPARVSYTENSGLLITKKLLRVSLVPTRPGELVIPPLNLIFFEPKSGEFRITSSKALNLHVFTKPGEEHNLPAQTPVELEEESRSTLSSSVILYLVLASALILFLLLSIARVFLAFLSRRRRARAALSSAGMAELRSFLLSQEDDTSGWKYLLERINDERNLPPAAFQTVLKKTASDLLR